MCRRRLFVIYWVLKLSFGDVLSCVIRDVCLKDWGLPEGMGLSDEFRPEVLQRPRCGKYVHGSSWGWESKRQYVLGFNAMLLWIPGAVGSCSTSDSQGFVKEHEGFARYHWGFGGSLSIRDISLRVRRIIKDSREISRLSRKIASLSFSVQKSRERRRSPCGNQSPIADVVASGLLKNSWHGGVRVVET